MTAFMGGVSMNTEAKIGEHKDAGQYEVNMSSKQVSPNSSFIPHQYLNASSLTGSKVGNKNSGERARQKHRC